MLKENRLKQIEKILMLNGEVSISDLCNMFDVVEMTIRRDLDTLETRGIAIRTHGGAILADNNMMVEQTYDVRFKSNAKQKKAIARAALKYVQSGTKLLLDSSTTTSYLSSIIPNSHHIYVVTNGISIAYELRTRPNATVFLVGGEVHKSNLSCLGHFCEEMLSRFNVDIAFMTARAMDDSGNLYCGPGQDISVKNAMMNCAKKKILLIDSSKFNLNDFVSYASVKDINTLITDSGIPESTMNMLRDKGVEVIAAEQ